MPEQKSKKATSTEPACKDYSIEECRVAILTEQMLLVVSARVWQTYFGRERVSPGERENPS
jgi:hypothetical protein